MMKDVDTLSRHPNLLIDQYLATYCVIRSRNIRSRTFAYNYDVFHRCSNSHHVKASFRVLVSTSPSTPTPAVIHHFYLQFLQLPSLLNLPTNSTPTSNVFISPEQYTWLSFDSIIPSFSSLFILRLHVLFIILPLKQMLSIIASYPFSLLIQLSITQHCSIFIIICCD